MFKSPMKVTVVSIMMASLLGRGNPIATIGLFACSWRDAVIQRLGVPAAMWFTHFITVADAKTQEVAAPTRVKFHTSAKSVKGCYYDKAPAEARSCANVRIPRVIPCNYRKTVCKNK